jgi:hypothetical protein
VNVNYTKEDMFWLKCYLRSLHGHIITNFHFTEVMRHSSLRVHLHCEENENIRSKSEETTTEHMIVRKKRIRFKIVKQYMNIVPL